MPPFTVLALPKRYFSVVSHLSLSGKRKYLRLSAADIYKELKKRNAAAFYEVSTEPFCASIDKNGGRTEAYGIWECIFGGKTMIEFGNTAESTESDISSFEDSTFSRNIDEQGGS